MLHFLNKRVINYMHHFQVPLISLNKWKLFIYMAYFVAIFI